jgi:hypothetical protein
MKTFNNLKIELSKISNEELLAIHSVVKKELLNRSSKSITTHIRLLNCLKRVCKRITVYEDMLKYVANNYTEDEVPKFYGMGSACFVHLKNELNKYKLQFKT